MDINTCRWVWKKYEHFSLPFIYLFFSTYLVYKHILQWKFFSHILLVEDLISCTYLKIHRKIRKKVCMQQLTTMWGLPLHMLSVLKLHKQQKTHTYSLYYWPALTLHSPDKTSHWNIFPLLVCTKAAPLCTVHSWRIFKIKASCLSIILFLTCHARPFSLGVLWWSNSQEKEQTKNKNGERKEAMQCVLMTLGFCIKANMCELLVWIGFSHYHCFSQFLVPLSQLQTSFSCSCKVKTRGFRMRARDYFPPFPV